MMGNKHYHLLVFILLVFVMVLSIKLANMRQENEQLEDQISHLEDRLNEANYEITDLRDYIERHYRVVYR